ncbi:MAG TPA: tRNA epoxyqueuosine(34) reductase QueG [Candidatus Binatia bacterium]|jgi:epoxyqueuosine reductase
MQRSVGSGQSNTAGQPRNGASPGAAAPRNDETANVRLATAGGPGLEGPDEAGGGLEQELRGRALALGFAACGICDADDLSCGPLLAEWLETGRHGDMQYLAEKHERRIRPSLALAGARSVVVVACPYPSPPPPDPQWRKHLRGRVAAYAVGPDYHVHVAERLETLAQWLADRAGARCVVHVDGGPLVEKELARKAGLGWYGRNTNILRPGLGSYFVLGTIVTTAPLVADAAFAADHCGTCRACIPACPTDALGRGPTIDATRCISYLTIEHRGPILSSLRASIGNWVFGCDVCQQVCPWNADEAGGDERARPWLPDWLAMTEDEFRARFSGTALLRPKRRGLARNAAVALGNSANPDAVPFLARAAREHDEPLVRAHAAWALGRFADAQAVRELEAALACERVPPVRREIQDALAGPRTGA